MTRPRGDVRPPLRESNGSVTSTAANTGSLGQLPGDRRALSLCKGDLEDECGGDGLYGVRCGCAVSSESD